MMNPLLETLELPALDALRPEHVTPALDRLLAQAEAALEQVVGPEVALDYDAMSAVLDVAVERLRSAWSQVSFLQSVADTPALRAAHAENLPRVIDFYTRLGCDSRLFAKVRELAASSAAASLSPARRKVLADRLRDFKLGGAELQGAARERFAQIQERCADLSHRFGVNVLDATDAYELFVDEDQLEGVPDDVRKAAAMAAAAAGREGFKLSLQAPCYGPVMQFARKRELRATLHRAFSTRACELSGTDRDNGPLMRELVALRQEEAGLLGMGSYAHLSLVPKMAASPQAVIDFVRDLARRARPHAQRELEELREFARGALGLDVLEPWDRAFVAEQLKQTRYAFSSTEVKQYFTEPRVLEGLFRMAETLFGIAIRREDAPVWHESVSFYRIARGENTIAGFYLDLHARPGKGSGAWMDEARQRWMRPDGTLQKPLAHLVCNFAPPVGEQPALLTHEDVITLFHEFGHGLHHMLTRVDELAVSGIAGVEWDAAELPSQFMENFCWEWEVVQRLSAHVVTGAPLPLALFERMLAARNFHNGLAMLRLCELSLFDMRLHLEPAVAAKVQALALEVNAELGVMPAADYERYPNAFGHLFDGGYAAGYYGYAWAEVLSADAYGAFEEQGVFDPGTGQRYCESILEAGGSRTAMESFMAFRGREPRLDALLRHRGLT